MYIVYHITYTANAHIRTVGWKLPTHKKGPWMIKLRQLGGWFHLVWVAYQPCVAPYERLASSVYSWHWHWLLHSNLWTKTDHWDTHPTNACQKTLCQFFQVHELEAESVTTVSRFQGPNPSIPHFFQPLLVWKDLGENMWRHAHRGGQKTCGSGHAAVQLCSRCEIRKWGEKFVWSTSVGRRDGETCSHWSTCTDRGLYRFWDAGRQASSTQQSKENIRKIQTNTVHIHTPKTSTNHHTY